MCLIFPAGAGVRLYYKILHILCIGGGSLC
nr:MAG TPA: hypothetical protein [Caudoviricetes sp.]